ncbi:MAG: hypothetical protein ABI670_12415 [Chloroflexota bacterium]
MLAWIILLLLIVVEAIALKWWLAAQIYPLFFNQWAAFIYSAVLALDIIIAWLVSMLYAEGGTPGLQLMVVIGLALAIIVGLSTLFLRWVVRLDMTDTSKKDK